MFLTCCNHRLDTNSNEVKVVQLSSDVLEYHVGQPVHLLTQADPFDTTLSPRTRFGNVDRSLDGGRCQLGERSSPSPAPLTPRQQGFRDGLQLPQLRRYPMPPHCSADDTEETWHEELLRLYQDFVLDLRKGIYMTQLTPGHRYSSIHCQILEDLATLKVDQGSGSLVEFPLTAVSKVYRVIKNDDKWHNAGSMTGPTPMPPLPLSNAEHIVVVEFMRKKLAFVFHNVPTAQRFLMCMELLIRRAQEEKEQVTCCAAHIKCQDGLGPRSGSVTPMFFGSDSAYNAARAPKGRLWKQSIGSVDAAFGGVRSRAASIATAETPTSGHPLVPPLAKETTTSSTGLCACENQPPPRAAAGADAVLATN